MNRQVGADAGQGPPEAVVTVGAVVGGAAVVPGEDVEDEGVAVVVVVGVLVDVGAVVADGEVVAGEDDVLEPEGRDVVEAVGAVVSEVLVVDASGTVESLGPP